MLGNNLRHSPRLAVAWIVIYWAVFLISLAINHHRKVWNGADLTLTLPELIELWGWSDAGSYLNLGSALAESGQVPPNLSWIVVLWPIGMPFIYRIAIEASAAGIPVLLGLQMIIGITWFACLSSIRGLLLRLSNKHAVAHLVPIFFILSPFFRATLLGQLSIYSDSLTLAFLLLWLTLLLTCLTRAFDESQKDLFSTKNAVQLLALAVASGLFMALAALTRSQYRLVAVTVRAALLITLSLAAVNVVILIYRRFRRTNLRHHVQTNSSSLILSPKNISSTYLSTLTNAFDRVTVVFTALAVVFGSYYIVIDRYYDWRKDLLGDVSWSEGGVRQLSNSPDFAWRVNWLNENDLANFIRLGGQGYACRAEPRICSLIHEIETASGDPFNPYTNTPLSSADYRKLTITAIVSSPGSWLAEKGTVYSRYARMNYAPFEGGVSISTPRARSDLGASFAICFLAAYQIWGYCRRHNKVAHAFLGSIGVGTLIAASIAPSFVAHFEARYLLVQFFLEHLLKSVALALLALCFVRRMKALSASQSMRSEQRLVPKFDA